MVGSQPAPARFPVPPSPPRRPSPHPTYSYPFLPCLGRKNVYTLATDALYLLPAQRPRKTTNSGGRPTKTPPYTGHTYDREVVADGCAGGGDIEGVHGGACKIFARRPAFLG